MMDLFNNGNGSNGNGDSIDLELGADFDPDDVPEDVFGAFGGGNGNGGGAAIELEGRTRNVADTAVGWAEGEGLVDSGLRDRLGKGGEGVTLGPVDAGQVHTALTEYRDHEQSIADEGRATIFGGPESHREWAGWADDAAADVAGEFGSPRGTATGGSVDVDAAEFEAELFGRSAPTPTAEIQEMDVNGDVVDRRRLEGAALDPDLDFSETYVEGWSGTTTSDVGVHPDDLEGAGRSHRGRRERYEGLGAEFGDVDDDVIAEDLARAHESEQIGQNIQEAEAAGVLDPQMPIGGKIRRLRGKVERGEISEAEFRRRVAVELERSPTSGRMVSVPTKRARHPPGERSPTSGRYVPSRREPPGIERDAHTGRFVPDRGSGQHDLALLDDDRERVELEDAYDDRDVRGVTAETMDGEAQLYHDPDETVEAVEKAVGSRRSL